MPQRKSGLQELKKNRTRRLQNLDIKTDLRKTIKSYLAAVESKKKSDAEAGLKSVFKKIDKATKRNILHKNTAARRKSQFSKMLAKKK